MFRGSGVLGVQGVHVFRWSMCLGVQVFRCLGFRVKVVCVFGVFRCFGVQGLGGLCVWGLGFRCLRCSRCSSVHVS